MWIVEILDFHLEMATLLISESLVEALQIIIQINSVYILQNDYIKLKQWTKTIAFIKKKSFPKRFVEVVTLIEP